MTTRRFLDQRLRLHFLRAADAIASQGSLVKAAAALGLSQPALTKSLRDLEEIVGARLFERHARGVQPTAAGVAVVEAARRTLAGLRRLDEALDDLDDPHGGRVSLGVLPVAAAGILPGLLIRLKRDHPRLRVDLREGRTEDLLPSLSSGEIDFILGRLYSPPAADGFAREPLWSEPLSILARADHPLFDPGDLRPLGDFELALPTLSQRVGGEIDAFLARLELDASVAIRSSSYGFIRELLLASDRIAVMPRLLMLGDLLRGGLRVVPSPIEETPRPAGLITAPDRPLAPAGRTLVDGLRDYLKEIAASGAL